MLSKIMSASDLFKHYTVKEVDPLSFPTQGSKVNKRHNMVDDVHMSLRMN